MNVYSKRWGRAALLVILLGLLALGLTTSGFFNTAHAAEIRQGHHVVITADEVIDDDLLVLAQTIEVEGAVKGDVVASGREVTINGPVKGNVVFTGQNIQINGDVEGSVIITSQTFQIEGDVKGSVYFAGYSLNVGREANIGRNIYVTGFSATTETGSSVGRSVYVTGYQVIINGDVADHVVTTSSALEINGVVGGNVEATVDKAGAAPPFMPNFPGSVPMVAPGYRLGESAEIGGQQNIETAGRNVGLGETVAGYIWRLLRESLGEYIALLLIGGLLLWLWPGMAQSTTMAAQKKPLPSAGWGCLVTLAFPILLTLAIIVLIIMAMLIGLITFGQLTGQIVSIGAVSIAWVAMIFNFVFFTITKVIVAMALGRFIVTQFASQMKPVWLNILSLALGALVYELISIIPLVGWIVALIAILVGLGAMFIAARQRNQPAALPPVPPLPETFDTSGEADTIEEPEIPDTPEVPDEAAPSE